MFFVIERQAEQRKVVFVTVNEDIAENLLIWNNGHFKTPVATQSVLTKPYVFFRGTEARRLMLGHDTKCSIWNVHDFPNWIVIFIVEGFNAVHKFSFLKIY